MADREKNIVNGIRNNPTVRANAKWAKNTIKGTAKGVAIAAVANVVAESSKVGLRKALRHH